MGSIFFPLHERNFSGEITASLLTTYMFKVTLTVTKSRTLKRNPLLNRIINEDDKMEITVTRDSINGKIEEIITHAEHELIIVSPYIKLDNLDKLKKGLMDFCKNSGDRKLIFLIRDEENEQNKALEAIKEFEDYSEIYMVKNLHAKLYVNENTALLTSMNLYDYSSQHNHEIGAEFSKIKDTEEYNKISKFINNLIKDADSTEKHVPEKKGNELRSSNESNQDGWRDERFIVISTGCKWVKVQNEKGYENKISIEKLPRMNRGKIFTARVKQKWEYNGNRWWCVYEDVENVLFEDAKCIVCGTSIQFHINYPICKSCYRNNWISGNAGVLRCHNCGQPSPKISKEKPLCYQCYRIRES